ncbi:MAG: UTP--glucose-1-phosphate uridylyltransferase GalU [Peptococcaceae bacterium]|nr:UTP--glucose-1-phosphate uridylyltransferase GalU [Peptococcaceae bacterium]MDH7523941.1 UTP--glucose-1-phosphate uridylyltransferase GalU [Peptococcaceae bacterium]
MKIRKAVIPAAGLGIRFLPATKAQPKEMLPIVDKPAIQYIVEEIVQSGIESIVIITGRNKRAIEDHFDRSVELERTLAASGDTDTLNTIRGIAQMAHIHYVRQQEPLGLGHAVLCAREFVGDEPFAVLLGDDIVVSEKPALRQLMEVYEKHDTEVVGVQRVDPRDVKRYGIVCPQYGNLQDPGEAFWINDLVEKPAVEEAPSNLAVIGRYILKPSIFPVLEQLKPGRGGEFQLTDALKEVCRERPLLALPLAGRRFDVGDKLGYLQAGIKLALARPELYSDLLAYMEEVLFEEKRICRKREVIYEAGFGDRRRGLYRQSHGCRAN